MFDNFYNIRLQHTNLDLHKIDKDNKKLLELRSQSLTEQNKLQDGGKEDNANEVDVTTATEETLNNDEANLRGEEFSVMITDSLRAFDSLIKELYIGDVLVLRTSVQYVYGLEERRWRAAPGQLDVLLKSM